MILAFFCSTQSSLRISFLNCCHCLVGVIYLVAPFQMTFFISRTRATATPASAQSCFIRVLNTPGFFRVRAPISSNGLLKKPFYSLRRTKFQQVTRRLSVKNGQNLCFSTPLLAGEFSRQTGVAIFFMKFQQVDCYNTVISLIFLHEFRIKTGGAQ